MSRAKLNQSQQHTQLQRSGFTLVELLIVIVVIAILAAITVVAYNGVSKRAQASALQANLAQVSTKLGTYFVDNSTYPNLLSDIGITDSVGASYYYSVDNTANPATWCVTATNNTANYFVSSANSQPTSGSCPISNLVLNPSVASTHYWGYYGAGGTVAVSVQTTVGFSGSNFYHIAWTADATATSGGCYPYGAGLGNIKPGGTYTVSLYVRPSKAEIFIAQVNWQNSTSASIGSNVGVPAVSAPAGAWTRLSGTVVAPSGADHMSFLAYLANSGNKWLASDWLDCDAAMLTQGSTLYNYADGTSPGWAWNNGTVDSASTGPVL